MNAVKACSRVSQTVSRRTLVVPRDVRRRYLKKSRKQKKTPRFLNLNLVYWIIV